MNSLVTLLENQVKEKKERVEKLEKDLGIISPKKSILPPIKGGEKPIEAVAQGASLVDFLGISPSEWFSKGRNIELDKALTRNL